MIKHKLIENSLAMEKEEITEEVIQKEKELTYKLFHLNRQEEEYRRLKSRSIWLKEGDQNTSFFHKQTKVRKL